MLKHAKTVEEFKEYLKEKEILKHG